MPCSFLMDMRLWNWNAVSEQARLRARWMLLEVLWRLFTLILKQKCSKPSFQALVNKSEAAVRYPPPKKKKKHLYLYRSGSQRPAAGNCPGSPSPGWWQLESELAAPRLRSSAPPGRSAGRSSRTTTQSNGSLLSDGNPPKNHHNAELKGDKTKQKQRRFERIGSGRLVQILPSRPSDLLLSVGIAATQAPPPPAPIIPELTSRRHCEQPEPASAADNASSAQTQNSKGPVGIEYQYTVSNTMQP